MVERRLGRGLEFFLSDKSAKPAAGDELSQLELSLLEPSLHQPRREFDAQELQDLANSMRSSGVLQPILVRPAGKKFQIIAGERRWRAAKLAGMERIPAMVREITDEMAVVYGLVENIQRAELNAMEKASAFKKIQEVTKSNQADVAKQVGLDRSTVTNFLRLLELPEAVQAQVSRGTLSMGHARALLALATAEEQQTLAEEIQRKKLSVRQVESLIQALNDATAPGKAKPSTQTRPGRPVWVNEIEESLVEAMGTPVSVYYGRKRSKITIECMGREEFERVYDLLKTLGQGEELA